MPTKTVLITGANRGIGLAFVELYKESGWKVIATTRSLDSATDELKALTPYKIVRLNTVDEASILEAAEELRDEPIDLLINNAGMAKDDSVESTSKQSIMHHFEVNTVGPFLLARALLPNLRAASAVHGFAVIAQLSSIMGSISDNIHNTSGLGSGGLYAYRASKVALNMLTAGLAHDLKDDNIWTVALHPGYVATAMTAFQGPLKPRESVEGMARVIAQVTEDNSGKFYGHDGVELPW